MPDHRYEYYVEYNPVWRAWDLVLRGDGFVARYETKAEAEREAEALNGR